MFVKCNCFVLLFFGTQIKLPATQRPQNLRSALWGGEAGYLKETKLSNAARNILKYDSARNAENSRGVVNKPNERTESVGDCSDNCEATIELDNLQN